MHMTVMKIHIKFKVYMTNDVNAIEMNRKKKRSHVDFLLHNVNDIDTI